MTFKRVALVAAMLATAGTCWAGDLGLIPRKPVPKTPTPFLEVPHRATGRIIVKFQDAVMARVKDDGTLGSLSNVSPLNGANAIVAQFGLTIEPGIKHPEDALRTLQRRAEELSGKAQPDLAGILIARATKQTILGAAKAFNNLPTVEYVVIEEIKDVATPLVGACCRPDGQCVIVPDEPTCTGAGGIYLGDGSNCAGDPCGAITAACCLTDSTCSNLTEESCIAQGGLWRQGDDCVVMGDECRIRVCCLPDDTCVLLREDQCMAQAGSWDMDGVSCEDVECNNECGEAIAGNCFDLDGNGTAFCDDEECCNLICEIDPYCCDEDNGGVWDVFCAAEANYLCNPHVPNWDPITEMPIDDPPTGADHCASPLNGSCYEPHFTGGCNNQLCCNTVCAIASFCCDDGWSPFCAFLAIQECADPSPPGATPDYEPIQGYRTPGGYLAELGAIPPELQAYIPLSGGFPLVGWGGEGWNLRTEGEDYDDFGYDGVDGTSDLGEGNNWRDPDEPFDDYGADGIPDTGDPGELNFTYDLGEPFTDLNGDGVWTAGEAFTDDNGNFAWDPPGGLWGVGEQLLNDYGFDGTGEGNLTLGKTIKIAVIEWAYYEDHEDLQDQSGRRVITEPNQRLIMIPEITEPYHATACLSIINGIDNGLGVTGIAPEAQAYFFPLTSANDGPRELTAWTSALMTLGRGDVISCSYGGGGNLNTNQDSWTLIRLASDLGITCCIAAGNDCANLDNANDFGDSGGIVVGACSPGIPWYRLAFSNYCTAPDIARGNIVHVKAWGEAVTAAGYGILPTPEGDPNRSYTPAFNGTSAATPQIAGLVANLQGLAKMAYGIPLIPEQIRAALGAPGVPPPLPAPRLFGGFPEGQACALDLNPDEGPHMIGPYPDVAGNFGSAASTILNQAFEGFNDSPNVDDIVIVRGENVVGNRFSVKGSDNSYLDVDPVFTDRNYRPGGGDSGGAGGGINDPVSVPEVRDLKYFASGDMIDIVIVGTSDMPVVNTMILRTEQVQPGIFALQFVEFYDWRSRKWVFADFTLLDPGADDGGEGDLVIDTTATAPSRFVRVTDGRVLARSWTLGFTSVGAFGGDNTFKGKFDLFHLFLSEEFGEQLP